MRRWILIGAALLGPVTPGCRQTAPRDIAGDGRLIMELGGGQRSLAASLTGLGVELLPPRAAVDDPVRRPDPDARPPAAAVDAAADGDATPPPPQPRWFEVELQQRQTLMDLAHKHLGSGLRFKELLTLNGWTEKDARRLRTGQKVKIPRAAK